MNSVSQGFAELFQGRTDAFGTDDGGCFRVTSMMSPFDWAGEHLAGIQPLGVYPVVPYMEWQDTADWYVRWGCVDFDIKTPTHASYDYETEEEAHVAAVNLQSALRALEITAWIEATRSRGRHVWVFARSWVPARDMRRALLVASQIAGTPVREVNPKQEELAEGALGNYVRLPYPGFLNGMNGATQTIVRPDGGIYGFEPFLVGALAARSEPYVFKDAAELWVPPKRERVILSRPPSGEVGTLTAELNGLGYTIWRDGPLNEDRSAGLYKLAAVCRESGLSAVDALAVVTDADARWGKFSKRADGEDQLRRTVERAYS